MLSCQLWEKWKEIFIRCKKLRPCGLHADHCFFLYSRKVIPSVCHTIQHCWKIWYSLTGTFMKVTSWSYIMCMTGRSESEVYCMYTSLKYYELLLLFLINLILILYVSTHLRLPCIYFNIDMGKNVL